jgi:hypothetical protein
MKTNLDHGNCSGDAHAEKMASGVKIRAGQPGRPAQVSQVSLALT